MIERASLKSLVATRPKPLALPMTAGSSTAESSINASPRAGHVQKSYGFTMQATSLNRNSIFAKGMETDLAGASYKHQIGVVQEKVERFRGPDRHRKLQVTPGTKEGEDREFRKMVFFRPYRLDPGGTEFSRPFIRTLNGR